MGTAVLFPQDCLRPRSRHKQQTSGMMYPSDCAPISKRNLLPPAQSHEAGLLPIPGHGGHSSPMNIPRRGSNTSHFKYRKSAELRDGDYSARSVSDVPVYKILQHPKQGDTSVKVLAQFVMLDEVKARSAVVEEKDASTKRPLTDGVDGVDKCNNRVKAEIGTLDVKKEGFKHRSRGSDTKPGKICNKGGSVCEPRDASKFLNGVHTSVCEGYKLPSAKVGAVKSKSALSDKVQVGPNDSACVPPPRVAPKPFMTKTTGKVNDVTCKTVIVQHSEESHSLLPRLRRTSTEPQIRTHILDQYKSKVMHISFEKSKSESHAHGRGGLSHNTSSLSCQERWAGPAYTSSPSPSSLPLPKLCLPHTRFSSIEIPPLAKQYSSSVYMRPFLGSSAPSENGGAWDVAFATKSLRKMLNLDPC